MGKVLSMKHALSRNYNIEMSIVTLRSLLVYGARQRPRLEVL